jgi:hypothetical protein
MRCPSFKRKSYVMMEADIEVTYFEDREGAHKPKNAKHSQETLGGIKRKPIVS